MKVWVECEWGNNYVHESPRAKKLLYLFVTYNKQKLHIVLYFLLLKFLLGFQTNLVSIFPFASDYGIKLNNCNPRILLAQKINKRTDDSK